MLFKPFAHGLSPLQLGSLGSVMVLVTLGIVGGVYHLSTSEGFLQVNMSKGGPGFVLGGANATFMESRGK